MGRADLAAMRNLGPKTADLLIAVGITTPAALAEVGTVEAWHRLKIRFPRQVNRIAAYAIEGALLDLDWRTLPPARKAELDGELAQ
jgi:DNA transformation protein